MSTEDRKRKSVGDWISFFWFARGPMIVGATLGALCLLGLFESVAEEKERSDGAMRTAPSSQSLKLTLGPNAGELLHQIAALFEPSDRPCFSTTGLFFITKNGVRVAIPMARTEHSSTVKQDFENKIVTLQMAGGDCMYEIAISRSEKIDDRWVKARLLKPQRILPEIQQ